MQEKELLLTRALEGDVNAFEEIILEYETGLYNFAYSLTFNEHDARDLSQETWLKVFECFRRKKYEIKAGFYTYLCTILRNIYIDKYLRKSSRQKEVGIIEEVTAVTESEISAEYETKETEAILRKAIACLPEEFKSVLVLVDMQNLSYKEVSDITKLSIGTIKSRLSRAREKMRQLLSDSGTF